MSWSKLSNPQVHAYTYSDEVMIKKSTSFGELEWALQPSSSCLYLFWWSDDKEMVSWSELSIEVWKLNWDKFFCTKETHVYIVKFLPKVFAEFCKKMDAPAGVP